MITIYYKQIIFSSIYTPFSRQRKPRINNLQDASGILILSGDSTARIAGYTPLPLKRYYYFSEVP